MVLTKLDVHRQKNETRSLLLTIPKNQLKMDKRPKCKTREVKLIPENIGKTFQGIGVTNTF
jgi:hypothetical protein